MTSPSAPAERSMSRPRLPFAVYILAALMAFKGVLLLAVPVALMSTSLGLDDPLATLLRQSAGIFVVLGGLGIAMIASSAALVLRRRTGWLLAMVLTGVFVAGDIYGYLNGTASHPWMLLNIVTVFYLNQRDVRDAVGASTRVEATEAVT
jgi:heme/copper-type cytochrome/quinol oxidase subunit 3